MEAKPHFPAPAKGVGAALGRCKEGAAHRGVPETRDPLSDQKEQADAKFAAHRDKQAGKHSHVPTVPPLLPNCTLQASVADAEEHCLRHSLGDAGPRHAGRRGAAGLPPTVLLDPRRGLWLCGAQGAQGVPGFIRVSDPPHPPPRTLMLIL